MAVTFRELVDRRCASRAVCVRHMSRRAPVFRCSRRTARTSSPCSGRARGRFGTGAAGAGRAAGPAGVGAPRPAPVVVDAACAPVAAELPDGAEVLRLDALRACPPLATPAEVSRTDWPSCSSRRAARVRPRAWS
ncbi:hypothetical protein ACR6C2_44555 [Streptomyces sp. INA 01156]